MATKIQMRRGTAAQWAAANPVLAAGEAGRETDTAKTKIGDGVTAWASLGYEVSPASLLLVESGGVPKAISATIYDSAGNLTSITENGVTTTYTYDTSGNALTETRFGITRTFAYNAAGNLTGATI